MPEMLVSLATGMAVGLIFAWLRLPIPAPPCLVRCAGDNRYIY
ncbi:DUF1427 family protein [Bacillus piscicola]